jgi:hypothetical protein
MATVRVSFLLGGERFHGRLNRSSVLSDVPAKASRVNRAGPGYKVIRLRRLNHTRQYVPLRLQGGDPRTELPDLLKNVVAHRPRGELACGPSARYRGGWRPELSHSLTCVAVSICPTFLRSSSRSGPGFNWCALCSRRAFVLRGDVRWSVAWAPPSLFASGGSATLSVTDNSLRRAVMRHPTPAICPGTDVKV